MRELNVNEIKQVNGGLRVWIAHYLLGKLLDGAIDHGSSGGGNSSNTIGLDGASDGVRWGTRP